MFSKAIFKKPIFTPRFILEQEGLLIKRKPFAPFIYQKPKDMTNANPNPNLSFEKSKFQNPLQTGGAAVSVKASDIVQ